MHTYSKYKVHAWYNGLVLQWYNVPLESWSTLRYHYYKWSRIHPTFHERWSSWRLWTLTRRYTTRMASPRTHTSHTGSSYLSFQHLHPWCRFGNTPTWNQFGYNIDTHWVDPRNLGHHIWEFIQHSLNTFKKIHQVGNLLWLKFVQHTHHTQHVTTSHAYLVPSFALNLVDGRPTHTKHFMCLNPNDPIFGWDYNYPIVPFYEHIVIGDEFHSQNAFHSPYGGNEQIHLSSLIP